MRGGSRLLWRRLSEIAKRSLSMSSGLVFKRCSRRRAMSLAMVGNRKRSKNCLSRSLGSSEAWTREQPEAKWRLTNEKHFPELVNRGWQMVPVMRSHPSAAKEDCPQKISGRGGERRRLAAACAGSWPGRFLVNVGTRGPTFRSQLFRLSFPGV